MANEEEPRYLLDTNIVSELTKTVANYGVLKKLIEHNGDCAIAAPVWQEMLFGMQCLADGTYKTYLSKFLHEEVQDMFPIKNYTNKAAEIQATLRSTLKRLGKPSQYPDTEIAAIALANRMIIITRNVKHFAAIQEISDLAVENWFE